MKASGLDSCPLYRPTVSPSSGRAWRQMLSGPASALFTCPGPTEQLAQHLRRVGSLTPEQGIRILLGFRARWGRGRGQAGLGEPLRGCKDRSGMVRSLCWRNPF